MGDSPEKKHSVSFEEGSLGLPLGAQELAYLGFWPTGLRWGVTLDLRSQG